MAERREGDVFFSGVLLYKSGTWTTQKFTAQLKFESVSGMKRLDLYPINGNKRLPGSPSSTILLTHALGVSEGKPHAISRTKNSFQIMSPGERHQFSARSEMEKMEWIMKLNQIINHMPVDSRTYEFHVSVSPTTHSDNLQLKGHYILKVTETELHLFSASGAIHSKFWAPLGSIRKASHYIIPTLETHLQPHGMRGGAWGSGHRHSTSQRLLIIITEMSAPVGEGGFAFFTDSAKDIVATVGHRKEMRLQNRLSAIAPSTVDHSGTLTSDHSGTPASETDAEGEKFPSVISSSPQGKNRQSRKSLTTRSEEEESSDLPSSATGGDAGTETVKPALVRRCARRYRVIPMSHQLEKTKSLLRLKLRDSTSSLLKDSLFSPEEPHYVTNADLARHQQTFHEWKMARERVGEGPSDEPQLSGQQLRQKWSRGRSSTISTPDEIDDRQLSPLSSVDGDYVTMSRLWGVQKQEGMDEREQDTAACETSLGKLRGLERQQKIDIVSPSGKQHEKEFFNSRPRTNAFSEAITASPPSANRGRHLAVGRQQSLGNQHGARSEQVWQCDDDMCRLVPRAPNLAALPQKSGSDPQLSSRRSLDLTNSHEYLKILPPNLRKERTPKKPKPTPRKQLPGSLPLYQNDDIFMTPPTPTSADREGSPRALSPISLVSRLDVQRLLSSQRSLSESNLYDKVVSSSGTDTDDDYVDMMSYQNQPLYINYDDLNQNHDSPTSSDPDLTSEPTETEVTFQQRVRSQSSHSLGDMPVQHADIPHSYENARCVGSLLDAQDLYENGEYVKEFYRHGNRQFGNTSGCDGRKLECGSYGDSGLGSTPSCSPLLAISQRSHSLDDVRHTTSDLARQVAATRPHPQKPSAPVKPWVVRGKPCKWEFPCATRALRGQGDHTHSRHYENVPLIPSS